MARSRKRLNDLPDCLLCLILSKVPLKQAVRCSVLSKRWKLLSKFLPNLRFSYDLFNSSYSPLKIQNIINGILMVHSVPLEFFELQGIIYSCSPTLSGVINECINLASRKDVREMIIEVCLPLLQEVEVPISVFSCCKLRCLELTNLSLENVPDSFGGFACLESLYFYDDKLDEKSFELMLQLCPVLKILVIDNCNGLERLKIWSVSLLIVNIDFPSPSNEIKEVTANCPQLVSLTLRILNHVEKMEFELPDCLHLSTTVSRLEPFTNLKSLRKITLLSGIFESNASLLRKFPDLKKIYIDHTKYPARGVVQDISGPVLSLENLEKVHVNVASLDDALPLLTYLLQHATA